MLITGWGFPCTLMFHIQWRKFLYLRLKGLINNWKNWIFFNDNPPRVIVNS
jgi:hypothetical protein